MKIPARPSAFAISGVSPCQTPDNQVEVGISERQIENCRQDTQWGQTCSFVM